MGNFYYLIFRSLLHVYTSSILSTLLNVKGASSCLFKPLCVLFLYQVRWSQWLAVVKPSAAGVIKKLWPCNQQRMMGMCHAILYLPFNPSRLTSTYFFIFCVACFVLSTLWRTTVLVPRGAETKYRYFKGFFLESKVRPEVFSSST